MIADCASADAGMALGGGAIAYGPNFDTTGQLCRVVWQGPVDGSPSVWKATGHCDAGVTGSWDMIVQTLCGQVAP